MNTLILVKYLRYVYKLYSSLFSAIQWFHAGAVRHPFAYRARAGKDAAPVTSASIEQRSPLSGRTSSDKLIVYLIIKKMLKLWPYFQIRHAVYLRPHSTRLIWILSKLYEIYVFNVPLYPLFIAVREFSVESAGKIMTNAVWLMFIDLLLFAAYRRRLSSLILKFNLWRAWMRSGFTSQVVKYQMWRDLCNMVRCDCNF